MGTGRKATDKGSSSHRNSNRDRESSRRRDSDELSTDNSSNSEYDSDDSSSSRKISEEEITVSGSSNDSNPFGDSNFNEKFVWKKKIEHDVTHGVPLDMFSAKSEKERQTERMAEEFHFDQSKVRSEIRLREGRTKPIDVLSKHINPPDGLDIEVNEPYMVFKGLNVKEMEELHEDIKMHLDLDRATPTHTEFWEALMVVCDWELAESRRKDALDRARVRGEEPPAELLAEERGLLFSIEKDVMDLLKGKTHRELEAMRTQIESHLRSGKAKVVEYWEAFLNRLHIFKAKVCLREIHTKMLRKHLQRLEQSSEGEDKVELESDHDTKHVAEDIEEDIHEAEVYSLELIFQKDALEEEEEDKEAGSFSPQLLHGDDNEDAIDPEEYKAILERKRAAVLEKQQKRIKEVMASSKPTSLEDNLEMKAIKAMRVMDEGDAVFGSSAEVNLDSQVYWWHNKYRPRKPQYFNRVHTGYEWNKCNQTHYDHDNPPPKIVQGYKFNIFYPDLADKIKAPTYAIEINGNSSETCFIRFHAGPPYEDITFRIVNKEWEYSHKKGFKCTFERGILHVYFKFKSCHHRRLFLKSSMIIDEVWCVGNDSIIMSSITLEFRRECGVSETIQSLCQPDEVSKFKLEKHTGQGILNGYLPYCLEDSPPTLGFTHLLRIEGENKNEEIVLRKNNVET